MILFDETGSILAYEPNTRNKEMKDVTGKKLEIGQKVVTNINGYTSDLQICEIIGFTPQKVKLKTKNRYIDVEIEFLKFPIQVAIV